MKRSGLYVFLCLNLIACHPPIETCVVRIDHAVLTYLMDGRPALSFACEFEAAEPQRSGSDLFSISKALGALGCETLELGECVDTYAILVSGESGSAILPGQAVAGGRDFILSVDPSAPIGPSVTSGVPFEGWTEYVFAFSPEQRTEIPVYNVAWMAERHLLVGEFEGRYFDPATRIEGMSPRVDFSITIEGASEHFPYDLVPFLMEAFRVRIHHDGTETIISDFSPGDVRAVDQALGIYEGYFDLRAEAYEAGDAVTVDVDAGKDLGWRAYTAEGYRKEITHMLFDAAQPAQCAVALP